MIERVLRRPQKGLFDETRPVEERRAFVRQTETNPGIARERISLSSPDTAIYFGRTWAGEGDPLTLLDVDRMCEAVAGEQGAGSAGRRMAALKALFARARPEERRFLVELFRGEVRQGALEGIVLDAVARAAGLPAADVRQAAMYSGHIGEVARAALEEGAAGLARFSLRLLSPVAPMLASPADDVEAALGRLAGPAAFEWKVDVRNRATGDEKRLDVADLGRGN